MLGLFKLRKKCKLSCTHILWILAAFRAREHHNASVANTEDKVADEVGKKDLEKMENNTLMNYFA